MTSGRLPFALPEFYMPYAARLNPHLEGARRHTKAWAVAVGILSRDGSAVWDEATFDAMDFALFTASTHPDAPAQVLETLTDWYVWGWYLDDFVAQAYEREHDLGAARGYLDRLPAFMPEVPGTAVPEPENPMERAACDLWLRTAPSMTPAWRRRFVGHIVTMVDAGLREIFLDTQDASQPLDPLEYLDVRRVTSGVMWSADLVEFSLGTEIPPRVYEARPVRVLNESFCDSVALRNDIVSYQRDVEEAKTKNGVMLTRAFLECDLQHAVEVVNDLVSSRLFLFEDTCLVELHPFFEEHLVDPATRAAVLRYVRGLQDWMGGDFEWETRPGGRYLPAETESAQATTRLGGPTGLGTSMIAAPLRRLRPGLRRLESHAQRSYEDVAAVPLPEIYMPYPARMSPHVDEVRAFLRRWFREMDITEQYPGGPSVVWDAALLDSIDIGMFMSLCLPSGSLRELELGALWYGWTAWVDDYYMLYLAHERGAAAAQSRRLSLFLAPPDAPAPLPANVVERSLADLWARMVEGLPRERHAPLRRHATEMFSAWVWESQNHAQNRLPDLIDCIEMRVEAHGAKIMLELLRARVGADVPPTVTTSLTMASLERAAMDHMCLSNDVYSYLKEIECEGDFHNVVRVMESTLRVAYPEALALVCRLMGHRLRQLEDVVGRELPALVAEHALDDEGQAALASYVSLLQDCLAGILQWHGVSGRYDSVEVRRNNPSVRARRRLGVIPSALRARRPSGTRGIPVPAGPTASEEHPAFPSDDALAAPTFTGPYTQAAHLFQTLAESRDPPVGWSPALLPEALGVLENVDLDR